MPSWSPDGQWIYYIESVHDQGYFPGGSEGPNRYSMDYPVLTRIHPDGTGAEKLLSGRYRQGSYTWFFWIRQPRVSPDGRTVAIVSDGPDPTKSDVVMQTYDVEDRQDAAARPARRTRRSATRTRPGARTASCSSTSRTDATARAVPRSIYRYDPASKKNVALSAPGLHAAVLVARRALRSR